MGGQRGIKERAGGALGQRLAIAADAFDVILIVQRNVLHDDAADADRLELADRGEGAGAPDLDFDIPEHGHGALGREFVRDRPARRARHETEALLPVDTVHFVDDAIDVVVEMGPLRLDLPMEDEQFIYRTANSCEWIGLEAAAL